MILSYLQRQVEDFLEEAESDEEAQGNPSSTKR